LLCGESDTSGTYFGASKSVVNKSLYNNKATVSQYKSHRKNQQDATV
jgi:hypothetical protein